MPFMLTGSFALAYYATPRMTRDLDIVVALSERDVNTLVTGAKGLNLAAADVRVLYQAMVEYYQTRSAKALNLYSEKALRRAWKAVRFSWWFTSISHKFSDDPFANQLQLAELDYLSGSRAALTSLAENYVGLHFE
jgi:p-hydroxybenzoate 3-monooxygenase